MRYQKRHTKIKKNYEKNVDLFNLYAKMAFSILPDFIFVFIKFQIQIFNFRFS